MPFTGSPAFSAAAKIAAHQAFANLIDSGAGNGLLRIRNSGDILLAEITLVKPCGAVNPTTGQLVFDVGSVSDLAANATGTAQYAQFCNSAGTVYLTVEIIQSATPVSNKLVMPSISLLINNPVVLTSAIIG